MSGVTQSGWLERVIVARSSQESFGASCARAKLLHPNVRAIAIKRIPENISTEEKIVRLFIRGVIVLVLSCDAAVL